MTIAVQLNGKLRGTVQLAKDAAKDAAEQAALALPEIVRALDGKTPKRVIVVPEPHRQRRGLDRFSVFDRFCGF